MINLFKKKNREISERFTIGNYEFSFDKENSKIELDGNKIIDLTIKASETSFEKFCELEDFEFGSSLYPPEFYARDINLGRKGQIIINEKNQTHYEIALYFMEHNDININLSIRDNWILIAGWTDISGQKFPIEIKLKK